MKDMIAAYSFSPLHAYRQRKEQASSFSSLMAHRGGAVGGSKGTVKKKLSPAANKKGKNTSQAPPSLIT